MPTGMVLEVVSSDSVIERKKNVNVHTLYIHSAMLRRLMFITEHE